ncbi:MAG: DUF1553 domain-containing protein [Planctomycetales bacterium]|nr:DUF1553 domain-containing protein [Planctomycetales bacterium]
MRVRVLLFAVTILVVVCSPVGRRSRGGDHVVGIDPPSALARKVDQLIDAQLIDERAAPLASESAFIRRVTLDLAGRIPTVGELTRFRESERLDKRAELVQSLIDSPDFDFHQRNELDLLLLRRIKRDEPWREYLYEAVRDGRTWDQMFREIMMPDVVKPDDLRPAAYLVSRVDSLDTMTNDSSILWFGVNVACAKCHDHPLVDDWKQSHYYGMASFFKRTFRTRKGTLGERFDGRVKYETTGGESRESQFMFLSGATIQEPELGLDDETLKAYQESIKKAEREDNAEAPPAPKFRPREQLVSLALHDDSGFFAKNIANRLWARMFGRGLVHPLDQIHTENPASHPELLELLADDLHRHGYDLKRLLHAIALTDAYARQMSDNSGRPGDPSLFASALPRALTPYQLALSFRIATSSPNDVRGLNLEDDWPKRRSEFERQTESIANRFEIPDEDFQVSVEEALWMSNNAQVQNDYLNAGSNRLVGYLRQIADDEQLIRSACRSILSREPETEEMESIAAYLNDHHERRDDAIGHIVWALLTSPEFRFNH